MPPRAGTTARALTAAAGLVAITLLAGSLAPAAMATDPGTDAGAHPDAGSREAQACQQDPRRHVGQGRRRSSSVSRTR